MQHSYQSFKPDAPLQSFAQKGISPYGYQEGHEPSYVLPDTSLPGDLKPGTYAIKVTATPVEVSDEKPTYVVSATPPGPAGGPITSGSRIPADKGDVVTHVAPFDAGGFSIEPLNIVRELTKRTKEGGASAVEAEAQAYVKLYGGRMSDATEKILQKLEKSGNIEGEALEKGVSRSLSTADLPPLDSMERTYNWIAPSGIAPDFGGGGIDGEKKEEKGERGGKGGPSIWQRLGTMFRGGREQKKSEKNEPGASYGSEEMRRYASMDSDLKNMFYAASQEMGEYTQALKDDMQRGGPGGFGGGEGGAAAAAAEERRRLKEQGLKVIDSPVDDMLGLPDILRPSVKYTGVEYTQPEVVGFKIPKHYKLHAIEVHQFMALPSEDEPWVIQNKVDPASTAIFGPLPMPFDPAHTGLTAPVFQRRQGQSFVPLLTDEMAGMFYHDFPFGTNSDNDR